MMQCPSYGSLRIDENYHRACRWCGSLQIYENYRRACRWCVICHGGSSEQPSFFQKQSMTLTQCPSCGGLLIYIKSTIVFAVLSGWLAKVEECISSLYVVRIASCLDAPCC
jgi:hypothetical protein